MKKNLCIIGLLLAIASVIILNIDSVFYPKTIEDVYQRCNSICIRDNGTSPCNCKEIIETESTTPLWYGLTFMVLAFIGWIIMVLGVVGHKR